MQASLRDFKIPAIVWSYICKKIYTYIHIHTFSFFLRAAKIVILFISNYTQSSKISVVALFHHLKPWFFSISKKNSDICNTNKIYLSIALQDMYCQGKVPLIMLAFLIAFAEKRTLFKREERPYIKILLFTTGIIHCWLKHGSKAELTQESIIISSQRRLALWFLFKMQAKSVIVAVRHLNKSFFSFSSHWEKSI